MNIERDKGWKRYDYRVMLEHNSGYAALRACSTARMD